MWSFVVLFFLCAFHRLSFMCDYKNEMKAHVPLSPSLHSECSGPLGMEGGIISNQQITASSTHRALFGLQKWYPYFARLNKKGLVNAWTAAENDRWPWIQVKNSHRTGDTQSQARARHDRIKTQSRS